MTLKGKLIAGYGGMGLLVFLYQWMFVSGVGFGAALGKALVWPAVLIPGVGAFIGAIILLAVLVGIWLV